MLLDKCMEIKNERGEFYWPPTKNFEKISYILEEIFWLELQPSQIAEVFIATKFARNSNTYQEDNIVDAMNYLDIYHELKEDEKACEGVFKSL